MYIEIIPNSMKEFTLHGKLKWQRVKNPIERLLMNDFVAIIKDNLTSIIVCTT